jgi:SAM-dependent methyltransferase
MESRLTKAEVRKCGDTGVRAGRAPTQLGWYTFASRSIEGKSVLDVGCGTGEGLAILKERADVAHGQDVDERLQSADVFIKPLCEFSDKSYDFVVSVDVIEHIESDESFVADCARIARHGFFLSTPNWTTSRCQWPFHYREYTPREFEKLLSPHGSVQLYKGTPNGAQVFPVKYNGAYHSLNSLRNFPLTSFVTRCVNHILSDERRIHSHIAAWVSTNKA